MSQQSGSMLCVCVRLCVESTVLLMRVEAETHLVSVNITHTTNRHKHKTCNRHLISSLSITRTHRKCCSVSLMCLSATTSLPAWKNGTNQRIREAWESLQAVCLLCVCMCSLSGGSCYVWCTDCWSSSSSSKRRGGGMSPAEPGAWRANQGGVWDLTEWFERGHGHILAIRRREGCFLCWHCVCVGGGVKQSDGEKPAATTQEIMFSWLLAFVNFFPSGLRGSAGSLRCVVEQTSVSSFAYTVFHKRAAELFKTSPSTQKRGFNRQMALIGNLVWNENTSYCAVMQTVSVSVFDNPSVQAVVLTTHSQFINKVWVWRLLSWSM